VAAEPEAVAQLVDRCAGLPLALSIVAARAANQPNLPLHQLANQLRDERERLDLLDLGERDLDVRAVLSWSYQVLSQPAARLFRLLGVHPGPDIDLLACNALIGDGKVGSLLTELTAAHLLEEHQPGRYRFHDLLRVYAKECAERDEPNLDTAKTRIADFYVNAVAVGDCHLEPFRGGRFRPAPSSAIPPHLSGYDDTMAWLTRENATLLAVLDFASRNRLTDHVARLARTLDTFLSRSGQRHERAAVQRTALEAAPDDKTRLAVLPALARAVARLGRVDEAQVILDEATGLLVRADADYQAGAVHNGYVLVFELRKNYRDALRHALRLLQLSRDQPTHRQAEALNAVARQRALLGSPAEALPLGEQAVTLYRELGLPEGEATALNTVGYIHQQLRQYRRAIEAYEQSLVLDRELRSRYWEARVLDQIGDVYALLGAQGKALTAWREAASIFTGLRHPEGASVQAKLNDQNSVTLPPTAIRS
jgi:tetratricopeptide (TPR) repeat protein